MVEFLFFKLVLRLVISRNNKAPKVIGGVYDFQLDTA